MVVIQPVPDIDEATLKRLIVGYTTQTIYQVSTEAQPDYFRFELRLIPLEEPRVKRYAHLDANTLRQYREMVTTGHSFGAFANEICVGLALSELQTWNSSLCLQELHVAPEFRRQGIGRLLVERLSIHARAQGVRCIVCETQTSDVGAIQFYLAMGFRLEGIDLAFYTNEDQQQGEMAVFMRKRLV
jgi:ribosomal protein S18 acetylase RimI-like enzyme